MDTRKSLILLACLVFVVAAFSVERQWTRALDLVIYDHHVRSIAQSPAKDVVVVAIDDASLQALGEWPWSRAFHAEAIDLLYDAGAKAVAYNLVFTHAREEDIAGDLALKDSLYRHPVVLPVYMEEVEVSGQQVSRSEVFPHPMFAASALLGHVNMSLDRDGVARTLYLKQGLGTTQWPHFSQQLLNLSQKNIAPKNNTGRVVPSQLSHNFPYYIPYAAGVEGYSQVSFLQLLTSRFPVDFFQDKIVLVGVTANSLGDPLTTPLTTLGQTMSAVEVNAHIFQALRSERLIQPVSSVIVTLTLISTLLLLVWVVPKLSGFMQLFVSLLFGVVCYGGALALLHLFNLWLPMGGLLLGIVMVAPLWNALRFNRVLSYFLRESSAMQAAGNQGLFVAKDVGSAKNFENELILFLKLLQLKNCRLTCNHETVFYTRDEKEQTPQQLEFTKNFTLTLLDQNYTLEVSCYRVGDEEQAILRLISQIFSRFSPRVSGVKSSHDILIDKMQFFKQLQVESVKTQRLFKSAIDEMGGGLLVADEMGNLLFHNQQAARMLIVANAEPSLFACLTQLQLKKSSQTWQQHVRQVLLDGKIIQLEANTLYYPDLDITINTMHAPQSQQTLLLVNIANIEKIKQAQRIRNETIDFLSHDMRAPMTSLLALTQRQREHNDIPPKDFLNQVEEYARTNLHYADQFLQLARVESSEAIEMYELDMGALVQNALDSVYHQAQTRGIQFTFHEADDAWVSGNGEILERVMINLLTNAVKYGQANSCVLVSICDQGDSFKISVQNSGPAISESLQQNLFKPYQRASQGAHNKQQGVGLGLRFVAVSLQRHGANIDFLSDDQNTCFFFHLKKLPLNLNSGDSPQSGEQVKAELPVA